MLDWKRIVQDPSGFKKALEGRGFAEAEATKVFAAIEQSSEDRKKQQQKVDELRAERNKVSAEVAQLMKSGKKAEAESNIARGKEIGEKISQMEALLDGASGPLKDLLETIPNWPHASVPVGKDASQNQEVRAWGTKPNFTFAPKSHDELAVAKGWIDFERAGKVSGSRFVFLRGDVARLERSLVQWMMDHHRSRGYEEVIPPYIVNAQSLYGTGQFPKFKEDVFSLDGRDQYLIPTAEVPVTNLFRGEVLDLEVLPQKFVAFSPCFRSEAGSYGRDTKGLIRQHQFHKVELVKFCEPSKSQQELEEMVKDAQSVLEALELPYRTMVLCTGDMGFGSVKTYDLEVWLPGSVMDSGSGAQDRGCYREISSCSDCGDFQARRADIRFREKSKKGTSYVHTLNGSGLAVGRTLVAILENYQNADGSVRVPKVLEAYMGGQKQLSSVL